MKKTLIITGIVVAILLLVFFIYILFFGTPKSVDDIFTNFNIGGGDAPIVETPITPIDTTTPDEPNLLSFGDGPFYKLTSRPVAGMGFVGTTTLRYAELGTGYIYEIDFEARSESLVSGNTFQKVRFVEFSNTGNTVILELEGGTGLQTLVGSLVKGNNGETSLDSMLLPEGAHDAGFTNDDVSYLLTTNSGTEIHEYDPVAEEDALVMTLPQQKMRAAWPHHVFTTPAAQLPGYVYDISAGTIGYVRQGGMGLTAQGYDEGVIVTAPHDDMSQLTSYAIHEGSHYVLPFEVFPEKCTDTGFATTTFVCAIDTDTLNEITFPDDWYKGKVSFSDTFYSIPITGEGVKKLFFTPDYPRDFDVLRIEASADGNMYLFIDKSDNTLWLFERPLN